MFTTQQMICALIVGLVVGGFSGAILWELIVTEPVRRQRYLLRHRLIEWQIRAYTAAARTRGHNALAAAIADNDRWSRKVTPLRSVEQ